MRSAQKDRDGRRTISGGVTASGASGTAAASGQVIVTKGGTGQWILTFPELKAVHSAVANMSGGLQGYCVIVLGANAPTIYTYKADGTPQDWHFTFTVEGLAR
jgi:hypothetical protein